MKQSIVYTWQFYHCTSDNVVTFMFTNLPSIYINDQSLLSRRLIIVLRMQVTDTGSISLVTHVVLPGMYGLYLQEVDKIKVGH